MQAYIDCSLQITRIFEQFTDRVVPYSIDEQFLDLSGSTHLFGGPREAAAAVIKQVWEETGIRCRIGMGENPLQAKMACDRFAKRSPELFFELNHANYAEYTWPLSIGDLFGVGHRMARNFHRMGVRTIGHLAGLERQALARRWGINGELLWLNAHGIDYSKVEPGEAAPQKGVGHTATLPRDYARQEEIEVVLLEMTEEVCYRARALGKMGCVVHVYCRGADFDHPTGFSRQKRLPEPSDAAAAIYPLVRLLFRIHWDGRPIRAVGLSLGGLVERRPVQLSLVGERERQEALNRAADHIRERFGKTSLFRASSLTPGAQLFHRAGKIGGHEA
jgi:DNA polymerase IV